MSIEGLGRIEEYRKLGMKGEYRGLGRIEENRERVGEDKGV